MSTSTVQAVLVTGCGSGIGRALALELHRRGELVYATDRDTAGLQELAEAGLRTAQLDVTSPSDTAALLDRLAADGVSIRVLVNNAGYGLMGPLVELGMDDVRRQFEVNTFAPLALVQALLPMLTDAGDGRVVNITSVSGVLATPFAGAYCASKFGLTALSDALRMELAPLGVTVVRIQPGHIQSRFGETAATGLDRAGTGSRYAAISDAIAARAAASQHGATSAEDFAKAAVDVILARTPRPVVTLGSGGRYIAAVARFLPVRLRDRGISRRFRLDELAAATNAQRADAPTGRAA